jgi:hypothetical protein
MGNMEIDSLPHNHSLVPTAASFGWTTVAAAAQRLRYAAFDAARAFLCAMAAIGQKPDIRLREEMGVDIG